MSSFQQPARPAKFASRTIIVYYDDETDPANPGWVTRCTEHDAADQSILGRTAMDLQLDAITLDDAIAEAAADWGCNPEDVTRYEGDLG